MLHSKDRWREQILTGLNCGIIRLQNSNLQGLENKEQRLEYLKEMTAAPGEPCPIVPESLNQAIQKAWTEPQTDEGDETQPAEAAIFDEELVGGSEYYEDNKEPEDNLATQSENEEDDEDDVNDDTN